MEKVCKQCEHLKEDCYGCFCGITHAKVEDASTKQAGCPLNLNCHNYCSYAKMCRYEKGSIGMDPDECAMWYKIDDLMNDARIEMAEERRRQREEEEGEDW
ncbi:MAG: hypothetical protein J6Y60_03385 [Treponema sp.]|nr:hypothetical protein [Treponema sp.]